MRKKFAINTKCATTFGTDFSIMDYWGKIEVSLYLPVGKKPVVKKWACEVCLCVYMGRYVGRYVFVSVCLSMLVLIDKCKS